MSRENKLFQNIADLKKTNDKQGRTYREINNATIHNYNVGDLIEVLDTGVRAFIVKQTRDCDGTPLYSICLEENADCYMSISYWKSKWHYGYSESVIKLSTKEVN